MAPNPAWLERELLAWAWDLGHKHAWKILEQHWKLGHYAVNLPCDIWFFFDFSSLFFPAGSRFWTVVLGSLQATKWLLYWPVSRRRGGEIHAMLFKRRLGFGWGQRAHVAYRPGIRYVMVGSHRRCCWEDVYSHKSLLQRRWKWHEQGVRTIWQCGQRWRLGARVLGFGGLSLWRVGGWTVLLLRPNCICSKSFYPFIPLLEKLVQNCIPIDFWRRSKDWQKNWWPIRLSLRPYRGKKTWEKKKLIRAFHGRPVYTEDSMIQHFCRHKHIGNWRARAPNISFWMSHLDDFLSFTDTGWTWNVNSIGCACLQPLQLWHAALTPSHSVPFMGRLQAYRCHSLTH